MWLFTLPDYVFDASKFLNFFSHQSMQLDELLLFMLFVLHLHFLADFHCRFCRKIIVTYVATDMR